jgi:hypothetical protein
LIDRPTIHTWRRARVVAALLLAITAALAPAQALAAARPPVGAEASARVAAWPGGAVAFSLNRSGAYRAALSSEQASAGTVTIQVFTGVLRSRVVVANPAGVTGVEDYASANYRQTVVSRAPDRVEIEIISDRSLASAAPFPVDASALPAEASEALVGRPGLIQTDDPAIVALAASLTSGSATQAQAVENVMAYVRGHLVYDVSGPRDASSALQTGRSYCVGFANLATALLRAAGIPARGQYGCVAPWEGWGSPPEGGRHMWVEVYYPDAGWVASDPQASANFVDTAHLLGVLDQCGKEGTSIQRGEYSGTLDTRDAGYVRSVSTGYASASGIPLFAASIVAPEAVRLTVSPTDIAVNLSPAAPQRTISVDVSSSAAVPAGWHIESQVDWLVPLESSGTAPGSAAVQVDGRLAGAGTHVGTLQIHPEPADPSATPHTVTVTMRMATGVDPADQTERLNIPIVLGRAGF